ncbi:DUF1688 family protein [Roseibium denhamense]|uniref:DUF1688 family protein n=1 Tax=Roseibium denhamense TaxID=76305 RepID=A0ABY1NZR6_9HYPH|nr:DUF1688 family protein [Roseibium denhamense]MTI05100.1 DUF1688 family protein [Roseibium denhamense]SMP22872.1 Protein of unknown function [Roseibium denhamense]
MNAISALDYFALARVRSEAAILLDKAAAGQLRHVAVDLSKFGDAMVTVLETTKENYPDLQIPPYGLWREFETGGYDRWSALAGARQFETAHDMLLSAADLVVLAAVMQTVTPAGWVFVDPLTQTKANGRTASCLAAFHMFAAGSFSNAMSDPYRVDADSLIALDSPELAAGLQWDADQSADLLEQMRKHLKRFGEAMSVRPDLCTEDDVTRAGLMVLGKVREAGGSVDLSSVLETLMEVLAPVWTGGASVGDVGLGDSFEHSVPQSDTPGAIVPFHLAAQEMAYSLVEPLAWAGLEAEGLEQLTAPADDRHAALFVRTGVLNFTTADQSLDPIDARDRMVEIRAVSAALAERLADHLRAELDVAAGQLPLTCILEGGTSRAGVSALKKNGQETTKLQELLNPGAVFWLPFGA